VVVLLRIAVVVVMVGLVLLLERERTSQSRLSVLPSILEQHARLLVMRVTILEGLSINRCIEAFDSKNRPLPFVQIGEKLEIVVSTTRATLPTLVRELVLHGLLEEIVGPEMIVYFVMIPCPVTLVVPLFVLL
jgi:hypothetical protein